MLGVSGRFDPESLQLLVHLFKHHFELCEILLALTSTQTSFLELLSSLRKRYVRSPGNGSGVVGFGGLGQRGAWLPHGLHNEAPTSLFPWTSLALGSLLVTSVHIRNLGRIGDVAVIVACERMIEGEAQSVDGGPELAGVLWFNVVRASHERSRQLRVERVHPRFIGLEHGVALPLRCGGPAMLLLLLRRLLLVLKGAEIDPRDEELVRLENTLPSLLWLRKHRLHQSVRSATMLQSAHLGFDRRLPLDAFLEKLVSCFEKVLCERNRLLRYLDDGGLSVQGALQTPVELSFPWAFRHELDPAIRRGPAIGGRVARILQALNRLTGGILTVTSQNGIPIEEDSHRPWEGCDACEVRLAPDAVEGQVQNLQHGEAPLLWRRIHAFCNSAFVDRLLGCFRHGRGVPRGVCLGHFSFRPLVCPLRDLIQNCQRWHLLEAVICKVQLS
eukprot:scaffold438_cov250-Pinguiococcus_pyrenoidosus.AAC.2